LAPEACLCVPVTRLRQQMTEIFAGWGMSPQHAETVAEVLVAADLAGIDSHGATLLALYEQQIRAGKASARPDIRIVRDRGAVMVIDAGAGFGQVPGMLAVEGVIERAKRMAWAPPRCATPTITAPPGSTRGASPMPG
jgi:LDH2 family malate/lactate/ureidoglycolate dehydrogenase